jgi:DNA-directed RNA polymerase specialized sigma subunit
MSNAINTMNQILNAGRTALATAIETYNNTEWSIEAEMALHDARAAWVHCQRDAQVALHEVSAYETAAAIHAAADAMMAEVNATMTAAHIAYNTAEWSEEVQAAYDAACAVHVTAQQQVNQFRATSYIK